MHPILFHLGPLTIPTYGLFLSIGFLTGIWMSARLAPLYGIAADHMWNNGLVIVLSGLLGGRLLLVLVNVLSGIWKGGEVFQARGLLSGGVFYGGLIAGVLGTYLYSRWNGLPWWRFADPIMVGVPLGHAIGRIGCFFAGCCYGAPCDRPWAVTFTSPDAHRIAGVPLGVPLHPTQLYDAGAEFAIFGFLLWLYLRKRFDGQIFLLYFVLYACARLVIEHFRQDPRGLWIGGLSTSQGVSLFLLAIAVPAYLLRRGRKAPRPARVR